MRLSIAHIACGLVCAVGVLAGKSLQQNPAPPSQAPPVFHAGVDLVQVDVSVLDKNRQPVRGLTAGDFVVRENGNVQKVETFAAVDLPDVTSSTTTWMKRISPDVTTNQTDERRLFAIVIDDATVQGVPNTLQNVKKIGHSVIDKLGPKDLATVIFTRDNRNTQDFTNDHVKLHAAVEKFTFGFRSGDAVAMNPLTRQVEGHAPATLSFFLASSVRTLQGVPIDHSAEAPIKLGGSYNPNIMYREMQIDLIGKMKEIFLQAQRANVNVYTIDACGFRGDEHSATCNPTLEIAYLQTVAENTGGRAIINTDDFEPGIKQIFVENSSYYLLGYRRTKPQGVGEYSRLEVFVPDRKGVEVRSKRINYHEATDDERAVKAHERPPTPAEKALAGILPNPDTPMHVTLAPFAVSGGGSKSASTAVAIVLGIRDPAPSRTEVAAETRLTETVDVLVRAFTPEGDARGSSKAQTAQVRLRPRSADEKTNAAPAVGATMAGYEILARIDLAKPGRYSLRLAVHNRTQNTDGSVFADVDVPDFARVPLSLSGAVLTSAAAPPSAPEGALATLLPVVPTSEREFTASSQVRAFLRVYEGGKEPLAPVVMKITMLDNKDVAVFATSAVIPPARFTVDRSADFTFDLPLASLEPGQYALMFETTMGKATARRDVVFAVK
jgi:VWFA-related protein